MAISREGEPKIRRGKVYGQLGIRNRLHIRSFFPPIAVETPWISEGNGAVNQGLQIPTRDPSFTVRGGSSVGGSKRSMTKSSPPLTTMSTFDVSTLVRTIAVTGAREARCCG